MFAYDDRYTPIRRYGFVPDVPQPEPKLPLDYDVSNGHFFSQTAGYDGRIGFTVTNEDGVSFWNEFRRLGGIDALGFPLTQRFNSHGRIVQILESGVLHCNADERRAWLGSPPPDLHTAAPDWAREPERSPLLPKT